MKRTLSLTVALLAAAFAFSAAGCAKTGNDPADNAQKGKWYAMNAVSNSYSFPEYDGEESLSWDEIIEFDQIPQETLEGMSTEGLIETCLDYPLYAAGMIFSNSTVYEGFLKTRREFNGLEELMKREDAPEKLVRLYSRTSPAFVKKNDDSPSLKMTYLQYIIAQNEILDGLSIEQRKQLLDECMNKIEQFSSLGNAFSPVPTLMIAARICKKDSPEFRELMNDEQWLHGLASSGNLMSTGDGALQKALDAMNEYRKG